MTIKYDIFQPWGSISYAPEYPCTVTVLETNGSFQSFEIAYLRQAMEFSPNIVALKFHKPDPIIARAQVIAKAIQMDSANTREVIRKTLAYLRDESSEKVNVNLLDHGGRTEWLSEQLDLLGIYNTTDRKGIKNWFHSPADYPTTPYLKNNEILTSKSVCGGRVVVLPSGHTISFTKARQIWNEMRGKDICNTYGYNINGCKINVGEYSGGRITYSNHRCVITQTDVSIGCQKVSRKAIEAFAKLEGWK